MRPGARAWQRLQARCMNPRRAAGSWGDVVASGLAPGPGPKLAQLKSAYPFVIPWQRIPVAAVNAK